MRYREAVLERELCWLESKILHSDQYISYFTNLILASTLPDLQTHSLGPGHDITKNGTILGNRKTNPGSFGGILPLIRLDIGTLSQLSPLYSSTRSSMLAHSVPTRQVAVPMSNDLGEVLRISS